MFWKEYDSTQNSGSSIELIVESKVLKMFNFIESQNKSPFRMQLKKKSIILSPVCQIFDEWVHKERLLIRQTQAGVIEIYAKVKQSKLYATQFN